MNSIKCVAVALCAVLCLAGPSGGQEGGAADRFAGHGIAVIADGDLPGARESALADAQVKAVLDAAFSMLTVETVAAHGSRLVRHFAVKPEQYLLSFRITGENALQDHYQVSVQAAVQLDLVRRELASLGLVKSGDDGAVRILVMAAETGLDAPGEIFWWSLTARTDPSAFPLQQALESALADNGAQVISPFSPPLKDLFKTVGLDARPALEPLCRLAEQAGAHLIVLVQSSLKRVQAQRHASVRSVQCDIVAQAVDVRRREPVTHAATYGLGSHVDEASACREAVQRASRQLADQITDRLYQQLRQARDYEFRLSFNRAVSDADVRDCIAAFKQVLPGLEIVDVVPGAGPESWTAHITSPAPDAGALQAMFGPGVAGYITRIGSVRDNVIEMRVTPIKRR